MAGEQSILDQRAVSGAWLDAQQFPQLEYWSPASSPKVSASSSPHPRRARASSSPMSG